MATQTPDAIRPGERPRPAPLAVPPEASALTSEPNLRETLARIELLLARGERHD